jgi:hypothetical protein
MLQRPHDAGDDDSVSLWHSPDHLARRLIEVFKEGQNEHSVYEMPPRIVSWRGEKRG